VRLSAGAEFVVVVCGDIMTMPGLPKVPAPTTSRSGPTAASPAYSDWLGGPPPAKNFAATRA